VAIHSVLQSQYSSKTLYLLILNRHEASSCMGSTHQSVGTQVVLPLGLALTRQRRQLRACIDSLLAAHQSLLEQTIAYQGLHRLQVEFWYLLNISFTFRSFLLATTVRWAWHDATSYAAKLSSTPA
jgi:hypothetical protein